MPLRDPFHLLPAMNNRVSVFAALLTFAGLFLLATPSASAAGPLIIGVRGGVPLTDIVDSVSEQNVHTATKDYVVGPTLGIRLPAGFSVVGDVLYQRLDVDVTSSELQVFSVTANAWQFPIMLKFSASGAVAPFVGAGVSVRHLGDFGDIGDYITGSSGGDVVEHNNTVGFVIGGGLHFKAGPLQISPEIRYTRWGSDNIAGGFRQFLESNKNDAQVLVGLTF